jgi:hypothetical protein
MEPATKQLVRMLVVGGLVWISVPLLAQQTGTIV